MRYFIGIVLPEIITKELVTIQQKMFNLFTGKLVAVNNLHITLLFLGNIQAEELPILQKELRAIIYGCPQTLDIF